MENLVVDILVYCDSTLKHLYSSLPIFASFCCQWVTGFSTGLPEKHFKDPSMADCGVAGLFVMSCQKSSSPGFQVSHLLRFHGLALGYTALANDLFPRFD